MVFNIPFILPLNLSYFNIITIGVQRENYNKEKNKEEKNIKRPIVTRVC